MLNAKSLLDTLIGGLGQMTGGQGAKGLTDKAKASWDSQSTLGKGAIAGGLLGVLLTRGGRRMLGTGIKIGSMAAIGGLAYKAYADWKTGRSGGDTQALPAPETEFIPVDAAAQDDLATRILQAMIGAAKADGVVTPEERSAIDGQLPQLGLGEEAIALIASELDAPLDVGRIAGLARTEAEATQIYAASLLVVDEESPAEKGYLAMLAARMNLDQGLVERLHAEAARL